MGFLIALILFLRRCFSIPWYFSTIALLTVPVIQIFAASIYVDLTTNIAASICALTLLKLALEPEKFTASSFAVFALCLVFVGNGKMMGYGVAAVLGIGIRSVDQYLAPQSTSQIPGLEERDGSARQCSVGGSNSVYRNPECREFGNPIYPVKISLLWWDLPGNYPHWTDVAAPAYLVGVPEPIRWLLSVLEFSAFDWRYTPWTVSQGSVPETARSYTMGGYFGIYVLLNLAIFMMATARMADRPKQIIRGFIGILTAVTAVMPVAHELRYYMYWIICLISVNLYLVVSNHSFRITELPIIRSFYQICILSCFIYVLCLSGARYFVGETAPWEVYVANFGIRDQIEKKVKDGDVICLRDKLPYGFLYASIFSSRT